MKRPLRAPVYYGLEFFLSWTTFVVMAVYLVNELHLSPLQLVLMGTAMEAAVFLFEIPTGVMADTYSRRLSLIIGYLGMGAAWTLVAVVSEPWAVIVLWAFWGISYTFTSGAYQAGSPTRSAGRTSDRSSCVGQRLGYIGAVVGLCLQVALGVWSLRAGVIAGGVVTVACGIGCMFFMPETGFRRQPRSERKPALQQLKTTALGGARFAWAAPIILLLISVELFMGMSSEAFDRLKEAHFLRDIGLPAAGHLDPVVWFGLFWLAGMVLGFAAMGLLIKRVERGGRRAVATWLFGFTAMEMATLFVFALTGNVWLAIAALLGVFFARRPAGAAVYDVAERADHRLVSARDGSLHQRPGERDRPGGRRPNPGRDRQRLGHPRRPGDGCSGDRPRARALRPGDRAPGARAGAGGAACGSPGGV